VFQIERILRLSGSCPLRSPAWVRTPLLMAVTDVLATRPLILVVDDIESVRSVLARALVRAGYHVITASSATEALGLLDQLQVRPHLAVIDLYMPGASGEELAAELAGLHPRLPVLFVSAFGHEPDTVLPGLLFEKPLSLGMLCKTVTHMLVLASGLAPTIGDRLPSV
jgi:CheY-like chemotaxis protein